MIFFFAIWCLYRELVRPKVSGKGPVLPLTIAC